MKTYDYVFKYITLGNSGVGKSSIVSRYINDTFNTDHEITLGVEFAIKNIIINDTKIKIQLWDTAGQEYFKSITKQYYRDSAAVILVYDIANRKSFDDAKLWLADILKVNTNPEIMLIGNKNDLEYKREVLYTEGETFAKENNMLFTELSAKTNNELSFIFNTLATNILNKINKHNYEDINICGVKKIINNNINVQENTQLINNENKKCCY